MTEWHTSWDINPPRPGDPDYAAYVEAAPIESARLAALIAEAEGAPPLWDGYPDAREQPGFQPDPRPPQEQADALRATGNSGEFSDRAPGIDAADLLALDLPPLRMVVPDLLPEGTTALAAPPKVGKSCLVYQLAVEVAIGGELLGRRVMPGSVLYLALEDGHRRGQQRLRAALGDRTMPRGRLEVRWSAPAIGEGLEEELRAWLDDHPDAAMVAIDTLQKVRQRTTGKRGQYEVDVDDLGRLQSLFRDRPVALVIVHHSRKESGVDDFLASVSGTYGITGSVDTIIVIRRKRLEPFGTIVVTGREVAETELSVRFDDMLWSEAPASLPAASFERMEVYRAIEESGPLFPQAIADRTGLSRTSVQNMVTKMVADGVVARTSKGYQLAGMTLYNSGDSSDSDSHQSHRGYAREETSPLGVCQGQCGLGSHPGLNCDQARAAA